MNKQKYFTIALTIAAALASSAGFAQDVRKSYTYGDSAAENFTTGVVAGGGGLAGKRFVSPVDKMITTVLLEADYPVQLDKAQIDKIIAKARSLPLATAGVGALGGGELVIHFDEAQMNRVLSAKNMETALKAMPTEQLKSLGVDFAGGPLQTGIVGDVRTGQTPGIEAIQNGLKSLGNTRPSFQKFVINLRNTSIESIETQLTQIMEAGATVKHISVRSLAGRIAPRALNTASVVGVLFGAERLGAAVIDAVPGNAWDKDYCGTESYHRGNVDCARPTILKRLLSAGPQGAWEAQEHNRQLDAKEAK